MAQLTFKVPISMAVNDTNIASRFGSRVAEAPILDRMRGDGALGSPGDFGLFADKGDNDSDEAMYVFIALQNNLPTARIPEMRNYRASGGQGGWSRPDALCHTRMVREYYEIKPESASSIRDGEDKFPNIDRFVTRFQLPYRRGDSYLRGSVTDEAPLLDSNASFQAQMQALQGLLGVRRLRLFIHWEKPQDGLIVYRAKVTAETDDPAPRNFPMQELAVCVVRLGIQVAVPGTVLGASATSALAAVLSKIRAQLDQLKNNLDASMALHQTLLKQATPTTAQKIVTAAGLLNPVLAIPTLVNIAVNPAMQPVVGAGVQMLNPAKHTMEIWKAAQEALKAGEAALQARNAVKALAQLAVAQASYAKAEEQLTAFRNGTELAARRAELLIKVVAAAAMLAAVAAYVGAAAGAATTTAATTTTGAGAATQAPVRVAAEALKDAMVRVVEAETPQAFDTALHALEDEAPKQLMRTVMPTK